MTKRGEHSITIPISAHTKARLNGHVQWGFRLKAIQQLIKALCYVGEHYGATGIAAVSEGQFRIAFDKEKEK